MTELDKTWKEALKRNLDAMLSSRNFLQIYDIKIKDEPLPLMQLGLAVMLDKPIVLALPKGAVMPENLRRLAKRVFEYDPADPQGLAGKIADYLKEREDEVPSKA